VAILKNLRITRSRPLSFEVVPGATFVEACLSAVGMSIDFEVAVEFKFNESTYRITPEDAVKAVKLKPRKLPLP
jgi:hypothetical protein